MNDTVLEDCPPGLPRCPCVCGPGFNCSQPPPFTWGFEGPEPAIPNLSMPTEQANHPSPVLPQVENRLPKAGHPATPALFPDI